MSDIAFPRVKILSIQVRQENEGKEEGARKVQQHFPFGNVEGILENAEDIVQRNDRYTLAYSLSVRAVSEEGAKATARAFVRAKNPTEPSVVNVVRIRQVKVGRLRRLLNEGYEDVNPPNILNMYTVTVAIDK